MRALILTSIALVLLLSACKDDNKVDPQAPLINSLSEELTPLGLDPPDWTDTELSFLDAYKDKAIVGLGEATHGTSQFFEAKHRMLKYLVEKHGFRIFAIEADIGESIYLNEAVLNSDKNSITNIMIQRMHFWTWRNLEVRDMLYWMCDYNQGKPENEKVQYWGIDCQFNDINPKLIKQYLAPADVSFYTFAEEVLDEAETATGSTFVDYDIDEFSEYFDKLDALTDSLTKYKEDIVAAITERKFDLTAHLLNAVKNTSEVIFYSGKSSWNYRDAHMAENTIWLRDYFDNAKIVLWAHNFHISDNPTSATMGNKLKASFNNNYATIGFLFSTGTFRAYADDSGVDVQTLSNPAEDGSLNDIMSGADAPVFTVDIASLNAHPEWTTAFGRAMLYFHIGAYWSGKPEEYYEPFAKSFFDRMIYVNVSTASTPL
jgi:erythromycin esterase